MNAQPKPATMVSLTDTQRALLAKACASIAPSWPLDQMIAVNPFWQMRNQPIEAVAARLSTLANANLLMPRAYYQARYEDGDITDANLREAAAQLHCDYSVAQLKSSLALALPSHHWHNIADLLDSQRDPHKMAWRDEIIHQISQFCAAQYQQLTPMLYQECVTKSDLYQHWLHVTTADKGISIVMDERGLNHYFTQLPETAETLIGQACQTLDIDDSRLEAYAQALLLDINGWASWVAYQAWQGELNQSPTNDMLQLLAIRMAWDLVIWRYVNERHPATHRLLQAQWQIEKAHLYERLKAHEVAQKPLWVWAKALELNYQNRLHQRLRQTEKIEVDTPLLQAIFCIDVRSEVMRRALEAQNQQIQTFGFAGFFGLPIAYQPAQSSLLRPQLPGLLKPLIKVSEASVEQRAVRQRQQQAHWQSWSKSAGSSFSMVESAGWLYAFKMLKNSFFATSQASVEHSPVQWQLHKDNQILSLEEKASLAYSALNAMGIQQFAPTVMLVGHGSHTCNNLHAAGLDCGACGGQTGEINVRVLATLLNDRDVRHALLALGMPIPDSTQFVAALHNTTTDHITVYEQKPDTMTARWLAQATSVAQRERLPRIAPELCHFNDQQIDKAYRTRADDWSQVRPEWGLANNAAFIVAPRSWTRGANLNGRCFLHDYQWQYDTDFNRLELIMTAPMIVTHWINSQYNASVTDNFKYGSGNKVLHNAVGGNIGLFEGNGGDLRIGLAMQSLHNGSQWMHEPLRLSVYLAAPRDAIATIYQRHETVRQLIDNGWLNLFRWADTGEIERFQQTQWQPCDGQER